MLSAELTPHESIVKLLEEALPGEDAKAIIRRKARKLIASARFLWKGPPFCPLALADIEGIIVREANGDIRSDGRIYHIGNQVYIEYAPGQCKERTRFTVGHELAHTLFPDCFKRERRRSKMTKSEREFENLCHLGASEFLFPVDEFSKDIGAKRPTANDVIVLAKRYEASIDATAHRILDLSGFNMSVVFANYDPAPGKKTILSVKYAISSDDFPYKFHRNLRINTKSIANIAYLEQRPTSSPMEHWRLGNGWGQFRVEATPLPKFKAVDASDVAIFLYP